eukprot:UN18721
MLEKSDIVWFISRRSMEEIQAWFRQTVSMWWYFNPININYPREQILRFAKTAPPKLNYNGNQNWKKF